MSNKLPVMSPLGSSTADTNHKRADKKQLALQRIIDSFPAQIDAIKEKRYLASIELRRFMMERGIAEKPRQRNAARLKNDEIRTSLAP